MNRVNKKSLRVAVLMFLVVSMLVLPASLCAGQVSVLSVKKAPVALATRITYSCVDKSIDQVLMDLAEEGGVDIIKSPDVAGNVTAKVTGAPLEEVLTNILAAHNFTYIATDG